MFFTRTKNMRSREQKKKRKETKSLNCPSPKTITHQAVHQPHLFILVIVGCICRKGNLSRNFLRLSRNYQSGKIKAERNKKKQFIYYTNIKYRDVQLLNIECRQLSATFILVADGSNLLKRWISQVMTLNLCTSTI